MALDDETASFDPTGLASAPRAPFALGDAAAAATAAAVASSLLAPEAALAKGGEYGVVEGKVVSLIHPLVMGSVFLCSLGAGYTGLQWRRTRTLGAEISDAKKALKAPQAALAALTAALVPQMQKGEDWARSCHIGFNGLATALFAWQITTGWGITEKVLQKGAYWLAPGF